MFSVILLFTKKLLLSSTMLIGKNAFYFELTLLRREIKRRRDRCKNWMTSNFWQISIDSMTFKKILIFISVCSRWNWEKRKTDFKMHFSKYFRQALTFLKTKFNIFNFGLTIYTWCVYIHELISCFGSSIKFIKCFFFAFRVSQGRWSLQCL